MAMKVRYVGPDLGVTSLTNNKIYECIGVEGDYLRIIDNDEEDYIYPAKNPYMPMYPEIRGKFEIIEDDENGTLDKAING